MRVDSEPGQDRPAKRLQRAIVLVLGVVALGAAATQVARADMPGDVPDKVRFELGGMAADAFTEGAIGSKSAGVGATVNFEDIFDLPDSKQVARFNLTWHINKRQYLDFGYVKINRSGSRIIQQDVDWNGFSFSAGAKVSAGFNTQFPYAAWRYDFLQLEQVRISGSAGIDYLGLGAHLEADGGVTDSNGNPVTGHTDEGVDIQFPVPQIGLQLDWMLTRRLAIKMYNHLIRVNFSGINGSISESSLKLYWFFTKHVGINGGWEKESIDLKEYTTGNTTASFRYEVSGVSLYFNFAF